LQQALQAREDAVQARELALKASEQSLAERQVELKTAECRVLARQAQLTVREDMAASRESTMVVREVDVSTRERDVSAKLMQHVQDQLNAQAVASFWAEQDEERAQVRSQEEEADFWAEMDVQKAQEAAQPQQAQHAQQAQQAQEDPPQSVESWSQDLATLYIRKVPSSAEEEDIADSFGKRPEQVAIKVRPADARYPEFKDCWVRFRTSEVAASFVDKAVACMGSPLTVAWARNNLSIVEPSLISTQARCYCKLHRIPILFSIPSTHYASIHYTQLHRHFAEERSIRHISRAFGILSTFM